MVIQTTMQRREAYVELLEILKRVDEKLVEKIPEDLLRFFNRNKSQEYEYVYDDNKSLSEQNLSSLTLSILAMLNLNYWCESEEHKQELLNRYNENEDRYQEELRQKYNPDTIFEKRQEVQQAASIAENMQLIAYEEPKWYKKIFEKILNFFKIK